MTGDQCQIISFSENYNWTNFEETVALFLHFWPSKALKQPKTPQILSQNRTKTTGSNDLGPMLNHFF